MFAYLKRTVMYPERENETEKGCCEACSPSQCCGNKVEIAARGTGKCVTLDIIQNKGQVSSQADRRSPHVQTMPGVNIHCDICAVCYFHRLNCSRLTFSSKSHWP